MNAASAANPYAPPRAELADVPDSSGGQLASRGIRLAAFLLDAAIVMALVFVPAFFTGLGGAALMNSPDPQSVSALVTSIGLVVALLLLVYFVVVAVMVTRNAQTPGKRIVGIKVARSDGSRAGFWRIFLMRNMVPTVIAWLLIALVLAASGGFGDFIQSMGSLRVTVTSWGFVLLDSLLIFGVARRCLHDYIAGTIVVGAR